MMSPVINWMAFLNVYAGPAKRGNLACTPGTTEATNLFTIPARPPGVLGFLSHIPRPWMRAMYLSRLLPPVGDRNFNRASLRFERRCNRTSASALPFLKMFRLRELIDAFRPRRLQTQELHPGRTIEAPLKTVVWASIPAQSPRRNVYLAQAEPALSSAREQRTLHPNASLSRMRPAGATARRSTASDRFDGSRRMRCWTLSRCGQRFAALFHPSRLGAPLSRQA